MTALSADRPNVDPKNDLSKSLMQGFLQEVGSALAEDSPRRRGSGTFPIPPSKMAVVNAVYHRSHEEREPIEVRISHDELVVVSYPGPDRSIRMEDLKAGRAVSRRYRLTTLGRRWLEQKA
jgi:hypothetical protein